MGKDRNGKLENGDSTRAVPYRILIHRENEGMDLGHVKAEVENPIEEKG